MPTLRQKMMSSEERTDHIVLRLLEGTRCHTCQDLAAFFDESESAMRNAIKKIQKSGVVPDAWLVMLVRVHNIHPEWILNGCGPRFVYPQAQGQYESHLAFEERQMETEALRSLSSYALAQELLRRTVLHKT